MKHTLDLAKKLIAIPSVTGDVEATIAVLEVAKEELAEFNYTEYVAQTVPSLLFRNGKEAHDFKILLNAHLDIVPGNVQQYQPYERNGKLYGRGAYDMKSAAAVLIDVFKEIAPQVSYSLGLQLVTDEELASASGTYYQLKQGVRTNFAIIGECGSNLRVIHENKGIVHAQITTSGHSTHGAYPWRGKNAILRMNEVIALMQQHFPTPSAETFEMTMTVTQITTTNQTWNKIPDNCTATLDIRFPDEDHKKTIAKLRSVLPGDVTLEILKQRNRLKTNPLNPYITLLKDVGKVVTKKELPAEKTFAGSDGFFFTDAGLDAIEFGPVGSGQHDDDEWVDLQSLEDYKAILKTFLISLDKS